MGRWDHLTARPTFLFRYWAKVDTSGGPDACHPWTGAKAQKHGGRFCYGVMASRDGPDETHRRRQTLVYAHRLALVLATGIDPPDKQACHKDDICTMTLCCNERHLYWGTDDENRADWKRKYGTRTDRRTDAETRADALDQLEAEGII